MTYSVLGIGRVILNSALGVNAAPEAPLRRIELKLIDSGISHTILRPNFFMENFATGFLAPMVKAGTIHLAAADGLTSFISVRDIAAVVVEAFTGGHDGMAYNLTGPEALSHDDAVQLIGEASGRTVNYTPISEEEMLAGAMGSGMPESAARFMGLLYSAVLSGWAAGITDDVQRVTGHTPLTFEEFARQSAGYWQ